jgi:prepilin-type processing-associated H-X9-DG protein
VVSWLEGPRAGFLWYDGHVVDYSNDSILWATQDPMQVCHLAFSDEVSFGDITDHFDSLPQVSMLLSTIGRYSYGLSIVLDPGSNLIILLASQGVGIVIISS